MTLNSNKKVENELRALLGKLSAIHRHHLREIKNLEATIAETESTLLRLTINNNSSSPISVADLFTKPPNPYQPKPSAPKKLPSDVSHIDTFVHKYVPKSADGFELFQSELHYYKLDFINNIPPLGTIVMVANEYIAKDRFTQYKKLGVITRYVSKNKSQVMVRLAASHEYRKSLSSLRIITHNFFRIPQRFIDEVL